MIEVGLQPITVGFNIWKLVDICKEGNVFNLVKFVNAFGKVTASSKAA